MIGNTVTVLSEPFKVEAAANVTTTDLASSATTAEVGLIPATE